MSLRPDVDVADVLLEGADAPLSALFAQPDAAPRGLVVALPGGGMRAPYFHGHAHPSLSLLTLAASLGWAAVSLDRPGYGASADFWPRGLRLPEQAAQVRAVVAKLLSRYPDGTPVTLVGHSHGMKVAMQLAADEPDERDGGLPLLTLDLTGAVVRYHPDLQGYIVSGEGPPPGSGRALFWGDESLYPPGTFDRMRSPLGPVPDEESLESVTWPQVFADVAGRVRVPVRWRLAEHERWWDCSEDAVAEFRAGFGCAPVVDTGVVAGAGHNVSLGWAARAWHLGVLAFAEEAMLRTRTHASPGGRPRRREAVAPPARYR